MTEPESLGNCEPGTAVKLQGIVWQETDKGGKTKSLNDFGPFGTHCDAVMHWIFLLHFQRAADPVIVPKYGVGVVLRIWDDYALTSRFCKSFAVFFSRALS